MLNLLVREWGYIEVAASLSEIRSLDEDRVEPLPKKKRGKPSALDQVAAATLPAASEAVLREIASRFDSKTFLPSVADVREFIMMLGERPGQMKDRSEAFREILQAMRSLPLERLDHLAAKARHAGPSQLGPLSDAISASSISRRDEKGRSTAEDLASSAPVNSKVDDVDR